MPRDFKRSAQLAYAVTSAALLLAGSALGQAAASCAAPTLSVLLPTDDPRQALALRLSEHLQTLADVDRCAHVTLRPRGADLELVVESGDGRRASRTLQTEAELLRASDALLTLPPAPNASASPPSPAPPSPAPPPSPLEFPPKEQPARITPASAHFEFGLGAQARLGGSPLFLGGGLTGFADVVQGAWLIQVSTHASITTGRLSEPTLSDYYLAATAIGVGVGRRFEFESTSLDALLSPEIVLETQDADDGDRDVNATASDVRLDLSGRWSGPRRSPWRAFGSLDLEVSPAHVRHQRSGGDSLPPFPSWTCGLSVGVAWSTSSDP
jgi:hypothetical protein